MNVFFMTISSSSLFRSCLDSRYQLQYSHISCAWSFSNSTVFSLPSNLVISGRWNYMMQSMSANAEKQIRSLTLISYTHRKFDIWIIINWVLMFYFRYLVLYRDTFMGIQDNYLSIWNRNAQSTKLTLKSEFLKSFP